MTATPGAGGSSLEDFYGPYSEYVDAFLKRRSTLKSSLFPEKPAQMWFGYLYARIAMERTTEWLAPRLDPVELGRSLQQVRAPANGLNVSSVLWVYMMATTGLALEGRKVSPETARMVLGYWKQAFEAYMERCDPPSFFPPEAAPLSYRVLDDDGIAALVERLDGGGVESAQATLAAVANYSWLLECESRQGTFGHGLYELADGRGLLVREFADLSGGLYPWMDRDAATLPTSPVAVVLGMRGVEVGFDLMGVPRIDPEMYGERTEGIAVVTEDGFVEDCSAWLQTLAEETAKAHRSLFRTTMTWGPAERFAAGARTYARIWAPFVRLRGDEDDVRRLVLDPLDEAVKDELPAHLEREGEPPIWRWIGRQDRPTVFAPALEVIRG